MAEFTEVMRQARRMHDSFEDDCSGCPLGGANTGAYGDLCIAVGGGSAEVYKLIEERVMQWAAAHPEPVYPSWNEWYRENFPGAYYDGRRICPKMFGGGEDCDWIDCDKCRDMPIPADVATKLGIRPSDMTAGASMEGGADDE